MNDEGDLLFFQSTENYSDGQEGTFAGDNGDSFTGMVFRLRGSSGVPWADHIELIRTASVADGYFIAVKSMRG